MSDHDENVPLPVSQLRKVLPELRYTCPQTILRWQKSGVKSRSGERVRLASQRIGSRVMSSIAQVREFLAILNDSPAAVPAIRSPAERQRDSEAAARRLAVMGVVAE